MVSLSSPAFKTGIMFQQSLKYLFRNDHGCQRRLLPSTCRLLPRTTQLVPASSPFLIVASLSTEAALSANNNGNGPRFFSDQELQVSDFINNMSYRELQRNLKKRNLLGMGKRVVLQDRLKEYLVSMEAGIVVETIEDRLNENLVSTEAGIVVETNYEDDHVSLASETNSTPTREDVEYCVDAANNYKLVSVNDLEQEQGRLHDALAENSTVVTSPPSDFESMQPLLDLLPQHVEEKLREILLKDTNQQLTEIALDVGRAPIAWIGGQRVDVVSELTTPQEIEVIANQLDFGSDHRAGIDGCLHRISKIDSRVTGHRNDDVNGKVLGLTLRVGRSFPGNALMIADMLLGGTNASILFLGSPGTGKTSIVRDAARLLAEHVNVVVVDTSCEIAGAGHVPHPCIGRARRIPVQNIDAQGATMIQAVQNHTPHTIVIDEIGRYSDVNAAQTCKQRGVRLIASAHGDFNSLLRNEDLNGLLGGVETVTVGDKTARSHAKKHKLSHASKVRTQRKSLPIFDIVVELDRENLNEWKIVFPTADAVDSILNENGKYSVEIRKRNMAGASQFRIDKSFQHNSLTEDISTLQEHPTEPPSAKQCPICLKKLGSRKSMLDHVLHKKKCVERLDAATKDAFQHEFAHF